MDRAPRRGKHFWAYALFGMNKNSGGNFPPLFAVLRKTSIAIKLTGHELPTALALGLADNDAVFFIAHEFLHIQERLGKGGGDGLQLADVGDEGQHRLFRALAVQIVIQTEGFNMGFLPVLKVLDVQARQPGEAVKGFLVLTEVLDVGFDDGHGIFSF